MPKQPDRSFAMYFDKLPRSYYTSDGWRLATYEEATNGLQTIKEKGLLETWETARLLDGWISGSGYNYKMGNDYRWCMPSMLVIKFDKHDDITSGTLYKDISLSREQKEVALLLCREDWNYEVVYWVLNSLSESETMDPADVAQENIPFIDSAKFKEMNTMMHDIARKFVEEVPAAKKAERRKFSDPKSVREVLSGMIGFLKEKEQRTCELWKGDLETQLELRLEKLTDIPLGSTWIGEVASEGGETWEAIADEFWNFLSECFALLMVNYFAVSGILEICRSTNQWDRNEISSSQRNFLFASHVLLHLCDFGDEIIYSPLQENSEFNPANTILHYTSGVEQQPERFNEMLQANALGRCYENSGNYEVLDKLLIIASKGQNLPQRGRKVEILVIKRLLECGAKPGRSLRSRNNKTALHYAVKLEEEEAAKCLLQKCDVNQRESFINARDDYGRTALHRATEMGRRPLCELLLSYRARLDARDKRGENVLDIAVQFDDKEIIDLFAPLVCMFNKPELEAYISNVDPRRLLRQSLLKGHVEIVMMLLDKGEEQLGDDDDDQGRTTLHLATMCENREKAKKMVDLILEKTKSEDKNKAVAMRDRRGRTVLHEAALKGHTSLCEHLLIMNPCLINVKDKDGRSVLYDTVQGKNDSVAMWEAMYGAYRKIGGRLDDVTDRRGLTLLHVAAEQGRRQIVEHLLSTSKNTQKAPAAFLPRAHPEADKLGDRDSVDIMKRADFLGQTALHKAVRSGDKRTVEILLENGANPFEERDCDGRTSLHYVVERVETGKGGGKELAELLLNKCKSEEQKLLLLWASAAGKGPADQNLTPEVKELEELPSDEKKRLKEFLSDEKKRLKETLLDGKPYNLLQIAASIGHTGMTKELLSAGFEIADIKNEEWKDMLDTERNKNVEKVLKELGRIAGNDQPTIKDSLGRYDYAHGLAAFLLNPFLKPPIAVGICGGWGKGKSSVMIQTERILLETVAQLALLPSAQLSRSTSELPGVKVLQLTKQGEKRAQEIKRQVEMRRGLFAATTTEGQDADSLVEFLRKFLSNYEPKYHHIFKALAVMDSTKMLSEEQTKSFATGRSVPAIITVQYNAWKYRNETQALAGLAVEITKEIEGTMTDPQRLTTCYRNAWRIHKHSIWIEIIFPCLLAILLAGSFIWIVWLVFEKYKLEEWAKAKYACVPAAIVVVVWILAKSVMGVLKPVSTQLMNYISLPDHAEKLGYQDRVISDINFLKDEIGKKPSKICTAMVIIWHLVVTLWFAVLASISKCFAALASISKCFAALSSFTKYFRNAGTNMKFRQADFLKEENGRKRLKICSAILSFCRKCLGSAGTTMKFPPAASEDLRIFVFVDNLDRCQESVILQVLEAVHLVLAVCKINVILAMDKELIERAITKKHENSKAKYSKLADNYLQKIIQLPVDLPDPSHQQLTKFLESCMLLKPSAPDGKTSTEQPQFLAPPPSSVAIDVVRLREEREIRIEEGTGARQTPPQPGAENTIDDKNADRADHCCCSNSFQGVTGRKGMTKNPRKQGGANISGSARQNTNKIGNNPISIRDMLSVTYSSGEWDAICHFKKFATNCRKLPREWNRFLNYHRLVWNIFYINVAECPVVGWQVQLIIWIFICWEWKENMDILIQDWLNVGVLNSLSSEKKPSLGRIVEHFIEKCGTEQQGKQDEVKDGVAEAEQSNKENKMAPTSHQGDTDQTAQDSQGKESLLHQPEVEMKVEMCAMKVEMRAMKEQLLSMEKSLEELKNTINELKQGQGTKQATPKNENRVDVSKIKKKDMTNWKRLRSALDRYDVTMEGIEAFQRFRFHCIPGHLQWPLPEQEWEVK